MAKHRRIYPRAMPEPRDHQCATGVCDPQRTQGLRAPAPKGNRAVTPVQRWHERDTNAPWYVPR